MTDVISGKNAILSRLESGHSINRIWLSETLRRDKRLQRVLDLADSNRVRYSFCARPKLDELAGGTQHQGMVAEIPPFEYADEDVFLVGLARRKEPSLLVIADGIEDPHNLGAIIRSAAAAGAQGVIIPRHRTALVNQSVFRASAGTVELIPVVRVTNISQHIRTLKDRGFWIYGLDAASKQNWDTQDYAEKAALVIGAEGKGLSPLIQKNCDALVRIPMAGGVESLNASVSAALMMYKIQEKRSLFK